MRKRYLRKQLLKALVFVIITICFPAAVTLIMNGKKPQRVYSASESGKYVIINNEGFTETLDVEDFIPCAIMGQLSINNDEELLKCFAVIIRTYIYSALGNENSIPVQNLNIPYITYDEMETIWEDDFPKNYNTLMKIAADTSLETITCNNMLISPYYHSVSGGKTRNGSEVMNDMYSYLCSVNCPDDTASPEYFKAYYYTNEEFAQKVRTIDNNISIDISAPLETVQIVSRDSAGYVLDISIGGINIDSTKFYEAMQINSPSFIIEEYNGGIRITTYGCGHGLGLSLNYAAVLAANGSSYTEILNYFYTNIKISR